MPSRDELLMKLEGRQAPPTKLSDNERELLIGMHENCSENYCYTFKGLGHMSNVPAKLVRRTVRALARKGMTFYARGLIDEDGQVCGAGYGITNEGRKYVEENFPKDWNFGPLS